MILKDRLGPIFMISIIYLIINSKSNREIFKIKGITQVNDNEIYQQISQEFKLHNNNNKIYHL